MWIWNFTHSSTFRCSHTHKLIDGVVVHVGIHCDVISCQLARQGVRRGADESSVRGRGNAVGLTSIFN